MQYLEKQLVFSDSLDRFDQVGGDGVGQPMPLLDFLQIKRGNKHIHYSKQQQLILNLKLHFIIHEAVLVVTYIKVRSSMFQDELSGVGLVLTVVHIHLELISLSRGKTPVL